MSDEAFIYLPDPSEENAPYSKGKNNRQNSGLSGAEYKPDVASKYISCANKENNYHFHHGRSIAEEVSEDFLPHFHPVYEIFVYIGGKADFSIETAVFRLNPYDIIIVPPYTIHQPLPTRGEMFERYVINVFPDFFDTLDCPEYRDAFTNTPLLKHKIPGHIVKRSSIMNILNFFGDEFDGRGYQRPLTGYKIAELLYHINTIEHFETFDTINNVVQEIISYIDKNFDKITDVKSVTDNFFYSKNYLSKLFKKSTGITIPKYINIKKMENVEKLYKQGKSLTHACIEAGFVSYDNFAYTYKAEFGISPRKGLAKYRLNNQH